MPFSTYGRNHVLDSLPASSHVSAHVGPPGDTGANEVSGGIYARQPITFSAAVNGERDSSNQPSIPIPGGTNGVDNVGVWDAVTGGNFLGYFSITPESFGSDGNLNVTDVDLIA